MATASNDGSHRRPRLSADDIIHAELVALIPRMRRFATSLAGSLDEGDDLVQAACERAISRIDQWQPGTRLDSWVFRIIRNIHLDRLRARRVRADRLPHRRRAAVWLDPRRAGEEDRSGHPRAVRLRDG